MDWRRGWRKGALSAALVVAVTAAAVAPAHAAGRARSWRVPARLSLPAVLSALASWLGFDQAAHGERTKACESTEGSLHIDPNGCPPTGGTPQAATEGTLHIDPDG